MSSDPSDETLEERTAQTGDDVNADETVRKTTTRRTRKPTRAKSAHKSTSARSEPPPEDDAGEGFREHAADVLAATRERIVEKPLQAVLVAAAAGAFVALLLGAGRR
ncbi:MAG: hypothetical protein IJI03_11605 [Rudaea sp.]|nr:hypothetical protein [Rudaea sp.]